METFESYLSNPIVWFIAWIFLAITNQQVSELLDKIGKLLGDPFKAMMNGMDTLKDKSPIVVDSGKKYLSDLKELLSKAIQVFIDEINIFSTSIIKSVNRVMDIVAPEDKRIWRVFGALLQLLLFSLFIYADAIQGANNLSTLFPTLTVPKPLQDITFSLLIASVGVCVALGVILADIFGLTNFAPAEKITGYWKWVYIVIVISTLLFAISLSTILALSRVPSLVQTLDAPTKEILLRNASYAQSFVILPLLITTAFLYWGTVGALVLLCGLLLFVSFGLKIFCFFLGFLKNAIEWGLVSTDYLYGLFFVFIDLVNRILYGLFFIIEAMLLGVVLVARAALGVIVGPPILFTDLFMRVTRFFINKLDKTV